MPYEIVVSALYFFVGLLIGGIAKNRLGIIYSIVPALVIRTGQAIPFILDPALRKFIQPLSVLKVFVLYSIIFSFMGAAFGLGARHTWKMFRQRVGQDK